MHIFTHTHKKKKPHRAKKRPARHKEKPPTVKPSTAIFYFTNFFKLAENLKPLALKIERQEIFIKFTSLSSVTVSPLSIRFCASFTAVIVSFSSCGQKTIFIIFFIVFYTSVNV
jgi:hypothetical protein